MSRHLFNERKAAQAAAWLLFRAGGAMPLLKLMKLMYLAERRSLELHSEPLIGDRLVSMQHGPVLSRIYNHVNGAMPSAEGGWESWIADRSDHMLALRDPARLLSPETQLLALSDSDAEILDEIWEQFGHLDQWQLVEYTHANCPEWRDPGGVDDPHRNARLISGVWTRQRDGKCRCGQAGRAQRQQRRVRARSLTVDSGVGRSRRRNAACSIRPHRRASLCCPE